MKRNVKAFICTAVIIMSTNSVLAHGMDVHNSSHEVSNSSASTFSSPNAQQTIILDGRIFTPSIPLQIQNGRLLVPFREIGEAMNATINWQAELQRITMFRGNRYSIMHIGNPNVQYGEFTIGANGNIIFSTQNFTQIEVSPVIINNFTYIPLRAISETLGATVSWNDQTSTATIVSPPISSPAVEEPEPNVPEEDREVLPPNFGDFSNTNHFRTISSRQAQSRFNDSNTEPFILVAYDSSSNNSKRLVPDIQDVAQSTGIRIYGLDKNADNNNASDNTWMWSFIRQSNFSDPTIFYIHSRTNVRVDNSPRIDTLEDAFRSFHIFSQTGFEIGDFRNTNHFRNVSSREIENMNRNNDEFIFVLYDSTDSNSAFYVPILKAAAREANHRIYGVDIDTNPSYRNHLSFAPGIDSAINRRIPMMYLVYSNTNRNRTEVYDRPRNVDTAISLIEEFLDNSLNFNNNNNNNNNERFQDIDTNFFMNVSASDITNRFRRGDEFIIVVYNSRDLNTRTIVENISSAANLTGQRILGLNLSSTTFNNTIADDLLWLNLVSENTRNRMPLMIHYSNQRLGIERYISFTNLNSSQSFDQAFDFIQWVYPPR